MGANSSGSITHVTTLTMGVAPKLKFREGSKIPHWVIFIGLAFHVISQPSRRQTQYWNICVQFGAGFEYQV